MRRYAQNRRSKRCRKFRGPLPKPNPRLAPLAASSFVTPAPSSSLASWWKPNTKPMSSASASPSPTPFAPPSAPERFVSALFFFDRLGNFFPACDITLSEGLRRITVQDAMPALVLNSEALPRHAMDGMPSTQTNPRSSPPPANTGVSDERLMLGFSQGASQAFTEL